jgi:glycerol uptake facilitator-like aquaporin
MLTRKNVAMLVAEALGTAILTFSVLAVLKSAIGIPYFAAIGVGLTLSVLVATMASTSGAHVNPAVTVGLWTLRRIDTMRALLYLVAQFVGALAAFRLYEYVTDRTLESIASTDFRWEVLVAELVGAAVFGVGVAAALYQRYEGGKLALTIGGSFAVGILLAGVASAGLLNPAVALGVQSWDKASVIGPVLGVVLGMNLYAMLFAGDRALLSLPTGAGQKTTGSRAGKTRARR